MDCLALGAVIGPAWCSFRGPIGYAEVNTNPWPPLTVLSRLTSPHASALVYLMLKKWRDKRA